MKFSEFSKISCVSLALSALIFSGCSSAETSQGTNNQSTPSTSSTAVSTSESARTNTDSSTTSTPSAEPTVARRDRKGEPVDCTIDKCVALTFDDGPSDFTEGIVDTLVEKDSKATFFMLGRSAATWPEHVKYVHNHGMEIGDHTWDHPYLTSLDQAGQLAQINDTKELLEEITGAPIVGTRPPYGDFNSSTETGDTPFILWSVDSLDYQRKGTEVTKNNILSGLKPGAIVLMHDIHQPTARALPEIIDAIHDRGYEIVTVSELFSQPLTKNYVYYSNEYAQFATPETTESSDTVATLEPTPEATELAEASSTE